jgi:hypothetical protein
MVKQGTAKAGIPISAVAVGLALYGVWSLATWMLEGRIEMLQRPDAVADRAIYAVVANLLIGILAATAVLRLLIREGWLSLEAAGFGRSTPSVVQSVIALVLGSALYLVQGAPSTDAIVLLNAFSQVLVVSAAEVVVCWAVLGATVEALLRPHGRAIAIIGATLVASVMFGMYHFAHSAPFNTIGMVALLTAVGLVTSAFFFIGRDVYATILFHNLLGVFGVVQALATSGQLNALTGLRAPLLIMAMAAIGSLAVLDLILLRRRR